MENQLEPAKETKPPIIITMSPMHKHVHPFIAWMAVLNLAMVTALPGVLFAQDMPPIMGDASQPPAGFSGPPPGFTPPTGFSAPMPSGGLNNECTQKCMEQAKSCMSSGADADAAAKCQAQSGECMKGCAPTGGTQGGFPGGNFQPPPPTQPPTGGTSGGNTECLQKCGTAVKECTTQAGDNNEAKQKCFTTAQTCNSQCGGGNLQDIPQGGFHGGQGFEGQQGPGGMGAAPQCQLDRIKKQMLQAGKQVTNLRTRVAALEKKGVKAPAELTEAFAKIDDVLAKVKAATDCQALVELEIGDVMDEAGEVMREQMPNLERLSNLKTIYSRVDKQIKTSEKQLVQDKSLAKRSKVDINDAVAAFESDLNKVKDAYAAAKAKIGAGEVEDGFDMLESEVFDAFDGLGEHHGIIQQIGKLSTGIAQADRDIKNYQRQLDALKRAKKDTTEAQGILDEGKAKLAELKTAAAVKPIDGDTVLGLLQEMEDIRDQFLAALNELKGIEVADDVDQGIKFTPTPQFNMDFGGGMSGGL